MKILVTGAAGFIGFSLSKFLLAKGLKVIGLDNINDYYDPKLKYSRLKVLGIKKKNATIFNSTSSNDNFTFVRMDLNDKENLSNLFDNEKFDIVCNLAAQAGVRYSLTNPEKYIESNINAFLNILECCRNNKIKNLIYASSSSVYGSNKKLPFSVKDNVDNPISLYAATKKSNELMAHTYSHLFNIPSTGLRFFTVYGPWGRPDMALFIFTKSILENKPIDIYNYGNMQRDFTYIDDIVEGIYKIIIGKKNKTYSLYNIGNNSSINLMDFIYEIEKNLKKEAKKNFLPIQPGDVSKTLANVDGLIEDYKYHPSTKVKDGIQEFISWYLNYYKIEK
tara:strand:+ start:3472 stop:4476 length:1005 start_codon:yes stop_codon:yes gene_type:complete